MTTQCQILAAVSRTLGLVCTPSAEVAAACNSLQDFYDATVAEIVEHLSRAYPEPDELPNFDPGLHAWGWLNGHLIHETGSLRLKIDADPDGRVDLVFNARGALRPDADGYGLYESVRVATVTLVQSEQDASRLAVAVDVPDQAELLRRPDRVGLLLQFDEALDGQLVAALCSAAANDPEAQALWAAVCMLRSGWFAWECDQCGEKIDAAQRYVGWCPLGAAEYRQHLTCYLNAQAALADPSTVRY